LGKIDGAALDDTALGNNDGWIEGATNGFTLGFALGEDVGPAIDGKNVGSDERLRLGASLGLIASEELGKDEGAIEGAEDGSALGFTLGPEL
jgi:hypothetical protein